MSQDFHATMPAGYHTTRCPHDNASRVPQDFHAACCFYKNSCVYYSTPTHCLTPLSQTELAPHKQHTSSSSELVKLTSQPKESLAARLLKWTARCVCSIFAVIFEIAAGLPAGREKACDHSTMVDRAPMLRLQLLQRLGIAYTNLQMGRRLETSLPPPLTTGSL